VSAGAAAELGTGAAAATVVRGLASISRLAVGEAGV